MLPELLQPFTDPASRTWWPGLAVSAAVALAWLGPRSLRRLGPLLRHRSTALDIQLLVANQVLQVLGLLPGAAGAFTLATALVRTLDRTVGHPELSAPTWAVSLAYGLVLFVVWDASRYIAHRLMHRIPALWALHQVHHSAEVLSPLTLHRIHPLESALYAVRGALSTGLVAGLFFWLFRSQATALSLMGVSAFGLVLNLAFGNLRHSHVWIRFGRFERWFISPAQHQLHHADHPAFYDVNFGTWLAIWDRLAGSWVPSGAEAPDRFGVGEARNHGHHFLSAWFHPMLDAFVRVPGLRRIALATGLLTTAASAQEPSEEPAPSEASDADAYEIVVRDDDGSLAVTGSATVMSEEDLTRFEYSDIHAVLREAPGVYTRGEDGYGLRPNIGIRGAASDRSSKITLMEDGVLLAPAPYAAPAAYYFPMTTRMVGLEVFKGAAATLYGPQTVGGALNLITRPVPTDGPTYGLDLAAGLRQTGKLHAWVGTGDRHTGLLLEGVHLGTGGFKHLPNDGPTGFNHSEFMLKAHRRWNTAGGVQHEVQLKLGLSREVSHETYTGLTFADAEADAYQRYAATQLDNMRWFRTQIELSHRVRLSPGAELRTVAYHHLLDRAWYKLNRFTDGPGLHDLLVGDGSGRNALYQGVLRGELDSSSPGEALMVGTNDRQFHSGGVQTRLRLDRPYAHGRVRAEIGLRAHADQVTRLHTEDEYLMQAGELVRTDTARLVNTDTVATAVAIAAHAHSDISYDRLHLAPSARLESVSTQLDDSKLRTRTVLLPGMGLRYEASSQLDLFAGVHRGFSPVSPGQPDDVKPELSTNAELGARLADGERGGELAGFTSLYSNLVGECTFSAGCADEAVGQQYNGGRAFIAGVEASVRDSLPLGPGLHLPVQATYTATHAVFLSSFTSGFPQFGSVSAGDHLPYIPAHRGSLRAGLAGDRWGVDLGASARTGMRDQAKGELTDRDVPGLFLVDAAAYVDVQQHLRIYTTLTNALGADTTISLRPYGARPIAPRQVMVGLKLMP